MAETKRHAWMMTAEETEAALQWRAERVQAEHDYSEALAQQWAAERGETT